jgi:hypothetical protein
MPQPIKIYRTATPNNPPATLGEGELCVEMATPTRLWVGVPTTIDATGKKLLIDLVANKAYIDNGNAAQDTATAAADALRVLKAGDIMSGFLTLNADPTAVLHAATKQYVDAKIAAGPFVLKAGDTMTGNLNLSLPYPALVLNKPASGTDNQIAGYTASVPRWVVCPGNATPETGANAGSDFSIHRYDDAGAFVDWPFSITRATGAVMLNMDPTLPLQAATKQYVDAEIAAGPYVLKTGDTMTGNLAIDGADPTIWLNKAAVGGFNTLSGMTAGLARWNITLGDNTAESGGNAGSEFTLGRFDDAGVYLGAPFTVYRATGQVLIPLLNATALTVSGNSTLVGDVTTGNINCGGNLICAATIKCWDAVNINVNAANPDGRFGIYNELDVPLGAFAWIRATNVVQMYNHTAPDAPLEVRPNGIVRAGYGILCKQGGAGALETQPFNFAWDTTTTLHAWVGFVDVGEVSFVSDYRIKKDVTPLSGMWDTVKALRPIKYTRAAYIPTPPPQIELHDESPALRFPADDIERWGFIAHELQETLLPTAATGVKDQEGLIQSPNPWPVLAALTRALQEAMVRIETLEGARTATPKG